MSVSVVRPPSPLLVELGARLGHAGTPPVYTDASLVVRELCWRRLEVLLGLLRGPRRRVLDFGGGNGILLPTLASLYQEVVCVDLQPEMAIELAQRLGIGNARILRGEIGAVGLEAGHFDAIVAADVLEHIPDFDPILVEFARLLAPGGELLVSAPSENFVYELGRRIFGYTKPADHYHDAAGIERAVRRRFRLDCRRYFPLYVAPLSLFTLSRFVPLERA